MKRNRFDLINGLKMRGEGKSGSGRVKGEHAFVRSVGSETFGCSRETGYKELVTTFFFSCWKYHRDEPPLGDSPELASIVKSYSN